jgi:hypothetical protein
MDQKEMSRLCFFAGSVVAQPHNAQQFRRTALESLGSARFEQALDALTNAVLQTGDPREGRQLLLQSGSAEDQAAASALSWAIRNKESGNPR